MSFFIPIVLTIGGYTVGYFTAWYSTPTSSDNIDETKDKHINLNDETEVILKTPLQQLIQKQIISGVSLRSVNKPAIQPANRLAQHNCVIAELCTNRPHLQPVKQAPRYYYSGDCNRNFDKGDDDMLLNLLRVKLATLRKVIVSDSKKED